MLKNKNEYINKILNNPNDHAIYLIEKLSNESGFFSRDKKILLLSRTHNEKKDAIKTEYLNMYSKVNINPTSTDPMFSAGYYNIIEFNGNFDDIIFDSYLELCNIYAKNISNINFSDFFYSLVNMFQIPHEQQYKNFLGLYGEIIFIIESLRFNKNHINNWHLGEEQNSKYDFVFQDLNVEVKASLLHEDLVTIKHNQLFNKDTNFLCFVQLEKNNSGKTLNQLLSLLKGNSLIKDDYKFWIKVEKEKLRINPRVLDEEKLQFNKICIYDANLINPFKTVPDNITNLNYQINLLEYKYLSLEQFLKDYKL